LSANEFGGSGRLGLADCGKLGGFMNGGAAISGAEGDNCDVVPQASQERERTTGENFSVIRMRVDTGDSHAAVLS
jgi:hypothetical protein